MTLLTTMLDFSDTGEIGQLVDARGVAQREASIGRGGLLQGRELAQVFASLRANDLIWPYVVNGYLKGKVPLAFDLLFWNGDDTNLPGPMFCWYLRNAYLENTAQSVPGSWWSAWTGWLAGHAGAQVKAPKQAGARKFPVIEPAPGRYVKEKAA